MPRWEMREPERCVQCESRETVRCGRRKDGKQLFWCHGCRRRFTRDARLNKPLVARLTVEGKYRCPHCTATQTCMAGHTARGTRILKCHACRKRTAVMCVDELERCGRCGIVFSAEFPQSVEQPEVCVPCFVKAPLSQWALWAEVDEVKGRMLA